ncbi:MAG: 16S rRNA (uracil(1498)-N(3))-methyltransferase [Mariprofundaceae bacterium]|nr:16S rRNA (uracil(1498)-N(3))-methyltransferase [Mariprofundaceae bacterium]
MPHCRLFLNADLQIGREASIPADQAHYLRHVMRLGSGDTITVFNGLGGEYEATISGLNKRDGGCRPDRFIDADRELPVRIHIIQCANKSEKIETVLQKCTELGAASFQIASSERSQFKLTEQRLASRLERWQRIIIEAAEQSGRTAIPTVAWQPSLQRVTATGTAYTLHPESATSWNEARAETGRSDEITLAIGPEGGWSRRDIETLSALGFNNLTFGSRIMRTETAAPALIAAIQAVL